jgi:hypothetical protein
MRQEGCVIAQPQVQGKGKRVDAATAMRETTVVGSIIQNLDSPLLPNLARVLELAPDGFEDPVLGRIALALHKARPDGQPCDIVSVAKHLDRDDSVELSRLLNDRTASVPLGIAEQEAAELLKDIRSRQARGVLAEAHQAAETNPDQAQSISEHVGEKLAQVFADAPDARNKPHVILPGGEVTISEAAEKLCRLMAPKHEVFTRGKSVVSLCRSITGALVLEPVRPSAARSLFEKYGTFFAWRSGQHGNRVLQPTIMAEETAKAILESHVAAAVLPSIAGLVNCPVLVEVDNALRVCGEGYNPETRLLVLKGEAPPDVPLDQAVAMLKQILADFDFQSPSDGSRALAALLTPALKMGNLIPGHVPIDIAEADQSQSGKTYRQKLVAAIYNETPALVPLKREGVGGTDESFYEKLVNGRPFVQLDNYRGRLDSPALETFMTADGSFPCRVPHCREIEVDPARFFILMTSNGVETTRDLANRASIVRIRKRAGVQFPDMLGDIQANQARVLGSVFAVIREWHRQGKPRTKEMRHDFRDWCQVLDWIVQHICGMAPLMDGHLSAQERVSTPALTFLRLIALEVERKGLLGQALIASQIYELAVDADVAVPGLSKDDERNEEKARLLIGTKLAAVFKEGAQVELDGFTIARSQTVQDREGGKGLYMVKTYTFSRASV